MVDVEKAPHDGEVSSPEVTSTGELTSTGSEGLHEKLRGLLDMRVELDRDIKALAAQIVEGSSP